MFALLLLLLCCFRDLVRTGANVSQTDRSGKTCWDAFLGAGYDENSGKAEQLKESLEYYGPGTTEEVARLLNVSKGANVNASGYDGQTALMGAAGFLGDLERVNLLLEAGADVRARDTNGDTALTRAVTDANDTSRVIALLQAGADVNPGRGSALSSSLLFFAVSCLWCCYLVL